MLPLLAAVAPLLAGVAGGIAQIQGGREANAASAQSAEKSMNFQAQQSSTAHQREAADLEKAGLNRALTLGGPGAATGSGASYTAQNTMAGMSSTAQSAVDSMLNLRKQDKEIDLLSAQAKKTSNEAKILSPQASLLDRLGRKIDERLSELGTSSAQDKKAETRRKQQEIDEDMNERIKKAERKRVRDLQNKRMKLW